MIPAAAAAIRYAAMFAALGHEARVRIVRLVLAAHPDGLVAGEIQQELGIPASTLSHHLDALETAGLIAQRREGRVLALQRGGRRAARPAGVPVRRMLHAQRARFPLRPQAHIRDLGA